MLSLLADWLAASSETTPTGQSQMSTHAVVT